MLDLGGHFQQAIERFDQVGQAMPPGSTGLLRRAVLAPGAVLGAVGALGRWGERAGGEGGNRALLHGRTAVAVELLGDAASADLERQAGAPGAAEGR